MRIDRHTYGTGWMSRLLANTALGDKLVWMFSRYHNTRNLVAHLLGTWDVWSKGKIHASAQVVSPGVQPTVLGHAKLRNIKSMALHVSSFRSHRIVSTAYSNLSTPPYIIPTPHQEQSLCPKPILRRAVAHRIHQNLMSTLIEIMFRSYRLGLLSPKQSKMSIYSHAYVSLAEFVQA